MPVRAKVPEFRKSTGIAQTSNFSGSSTAVIFIGTGSYLLQQLIIFQNITANRTWMSESEKCFTSSESSDRSAETLANRLSQMAPLVGAGLVSRALISLLTQPSTQVTRRTPPPPPSFGRDIYLPAASKRPPGRYEVTQLFPASSCKLSSLPWSKPSSS